MIPVGEREMAAMKRLLFKALGEKASADNREADAVAWIRLAILLVYVITNFVICYGVWHHWTPR
jgi:hypothetical protein